MKKLILFFLFFLLPPFFSLLLLMIVCSKKESGKGMLIPLVAVLSLIGIYWFQAGDNQSHFAYYYTDVVSYYSDFSIFSAYWFYDSVIKYVADFLGQYVWGYYFWLFIPLSLFVTCVWKGIQKEENHLLLLVLFTMMFLGIRYYLDLNRNTVAVLLLTLSIFLFRKHAFVALVIAFVSLLLHATSWLLLLLLPVTYLLFKNISAGKMKVLLVMLVMFSYFIVGFVAPYVMSERNADAYLSEGWQDNRGVNSGFMYVISWLDLIACFLQSLFILSHKSEIPKVQYSFFLTSVLLLCSTFALFVTRERFTLSSNIIAAAIILSNWSKLRKGVCLRNKVILVNLLNRLFVLRLCMNFLLLYSSHFIFHSATTNNAKEFAIVSKIFYMPTALLIDIDSYGFNDKAYMQLYNRVNEDISKEM